MPVTPTKYDSQDDVVIQWVGETGTSIGIQSNEWPDKTIQASGTGTVTVQGSADNTNWFALNSDIGTPAPISLAAASNTAARIHENPVFIRVINTGGTATVTITGAK